MDCPLATLDDQRARRALSLLHDISADFQVIYLTTSDRYDKTADAVVKLAPATAVTPDIIAGDGEPTEPLPLEPAPPTAATATATAAVTGT